MSHSNESASPNLTFDQVQELLPGYALDALSPEEMVAVDTYLQQHETMLQQRYDLELASQAMAYSAPDRPLPARVKANLMQRVYADLPATQRRSPFATAPAEPIASPSMPGRLAALKRQAAPRKPRVKPLFPEEAQGGNWFGGLFQGLIGLAAVGATAILLFANWQLQSSTQQLETQVALTQQELSTTQSALQRTQTDLVTAQTNFAQTQNVLQQAQTDITQARNELQLAQTEVDQIKANAEELRLANATLENELAQQNTQIQVLTNANRLLTLAGTGVAQQASGTFFVSDDKAILNLRGLQQLPPDKTYQLWYIPEGGQPQPADLFQVEQGDTTLVSFPIPAQSAAFTSIGITIEPAGGSQTPTELVMASTT